MTIFKHNVENMTDWFGNKPKIYMFRWKRIHFGLFKTWLKYELFNMFDPKTNTLVTDKDGKVLKGMKMSEIELKWGWK